jgi:Tol biopolymer transport system component/DNA-binding winged helix-turn-helix (wHTH) protein
VAKEVVAACRVRFGCYEADLRAAVLRRNGIRLKLQDQPFRVLTILLEHPGEMVTREEFKARLWLTETFIDVDNSLNTDINKIREALGDSATNPRFIETIPRRGYRFLAPVEICQAAESQNPAKKETGDLGTDSDVLRAERVHRKLIALAYAGAFLAFAVGVGWWFWWPVQPPTLVGITQITTDGRAKGGVLLADSSRLYVSELIDDHYRLVEISAAGGDPQIIPSPFIDTWAVGIAPDGSSLLTLNATVGEDPRLWILPLPTGPPRRVGNVVVRAAAWSPDGDRIGYAIDGKPDVYVSKPDGSDAVRIGSLPRPADSPEMDFSPDGAWLHATISADHGREIWEIPTAGGTAVPLLRTATQDDAARYTSDGRYIAYQHHESGVINIWMAASPHQPWWQRKLRHPARITSGPISFAEPVPSKDGKHVFALGYTFRSELLRYDTRLQRFMPMLPGLSAGQVAPSPDGHWIAYISYPQSVLWRSRPDGSNRLQLSSPEYNVSGPAWSPDSKQIVFNQAHRGHPTQIMKVPVDGGMPEELAAGTTVPGEQVFGATWSADGKKIAYIRMLNGGADPQNVTIRVGEISSHQSIELPGSRGMSGPLWSLDGGRLIAVTALSDKIMTYDFRTEKWSTLVHGLSLGNLNWSQNGQYLYYEDDIGKESVLMRVPAGGGRPQRIAGLNDVPRAQWCNAIACPGTWSGLLGDEPIVQRDLSTQEIYRLDVRFP